MSSLNSKRHKIWISFGFICVLLSILFAFIYKQPTPYSRTEIDNWILEAAKIYEVEPHLIHAVVWKESKYQSDARGSSGELGLMQIRQLAAKEWADSHEIKSFQHAQVIHPKTNTLAGTWYLKKMLTRYSSFDKPMVYALADYNAGRQNVLRWFGQLSETNSDEFLKAMDFPTTKQYIMDVIQKSSELSELSSQKDYY